MYIRFALLYLALRYLSIFVNVIKDSPKIRLSFLLCKGYGITYLLFGNLHISLSFSHRGNGYQDTAHKHY